MTEKATLYDAALQATNKSTNIYLIISGLSTFLYASRTTIWVNYAQEFDDYSNTSLSLILFTDSVLMGVVGIFFSYLGDKIGFDKAISFKLLLITTGCILESIANSFQLLFIGFLISQTATMYVTLAYISWILPKKYARAKITMLLSVGGGFYTLGPIFSGILYAIGHNYRYIFIANASFMCVLCIIIICCVFGRQTKLEQLQIAAHHKMTQDIDEPSEYSQLIVNDNINEHEDDQVFPSFNHHQHNEIHLSFYKWYLLTSRMLERGCTNACESVLITFYLPFILNKYEGNQDLKATYVFLCTLQILTLSITFSICTFIISKYTNVLVKLYTFIQPNNLLLMLYMLTMAINIVFVYIDDIGFHVFWVYFICMGISYAFLTSIVEMLLLDIQPPKESGKVNGIKVLIINIVRGILLASVALLWSTSINAVFYIIAIMCTATMLLNLISTVITYLAPEQNDNDISELNY